MIHFGGGWRGGVIVYTLLFEKLWPCGALVLMIIAAFRRQSRCTLIS